MLEMEMEFTLAVEALPDEPTDLSNIRLNEKQKSWIILQVISRQETYKTIATKYHLSYNTIKSII